MAAEQVALRRVATLVASGASPPAVFCAVAKELAQLFGVSVTLVLRFVAHGAQLLQQPARQGRLVHFRSKVQALQVADGIAQHCPLSHRSKIVRILSGWRSRDHLCRLASSPGTIGHGDRCSENSGSSW